MSSIIRGIEETAEEAVSREVENVAVESTAKSIESAVSREVSPEITETSLRKATRTIRKVINPELVEKAVEEGVERVRSVARRAIENIISFERDEKALEEALRSSGSELEKAISRSREVFRDLGIRVDNPRQLLEDVVGLVERASRGDREAVEALHVLARRLSPEERTALARAVRKYISRVAKNRIVKLLPALGVLAGAGALLYMSEPNRHLREYQNELWRGLEEYRREMSRKIRNRAIRGEIENLLYGYLNARLEQYARSMSSPLGALTAHEHGRPVKDMEKIASTVMRASRELLREIERSDIYEKILDLYRKYGSLIKKVVKRRNTVNAVFTFTDSEVFQMLERWLREHPQVLKKLEKEYTDLLKRLGIPKNIAERNGFSFRDFLRTVMWVTVYEISSSASRSVSA